MDLVESLSGMMDFSRVEIMSQERLMGLMASAWWCKSSYNVVGEAELSRNPSCGKSASSYSSLAQRLGVPCGNKLQLPKVWFNMCTGEP